MYPHGFPSFSGTASRPPWKPCVSTSRSSPLMGRQERHVPTRRRWKTGGMRPISRDSPRFSRFFRLVRETCARILARCGATPPASWSRGPRLGGPAVFFAARGGLQRGLDAVPGLSAVVAPPGDVRPPGVAAGRIGPLLQRRPSSLTRSMLPYPRLPKKQECRDGCTGPRSLGAAPSALCCLSPSAPAVGSSVVHFRRASTTHSSPSSGEFRRDWTSVAETEKLSRDRSPTDRCQGRAERDLLSRSLSAGSFPVRREQVLEPNTRRAVAKIVPRVRSVVVVSSFNQEMPRTDSRRFPLDSRRFDPSATVYGRAFGPPLRLASPRSPPELIRLDAASAPTAHVPRRAARALGGRDRVQALRPASRWRGPVERGAGGVGHSRGRRFAPCGLPSRLMAALALPAVQ